MAPHDSAITICAAAAAGVFLIAAAERLRIPSIALLLVGGVLLGPEVLGWINPKSLGEGLEVVVTLAVAIVLFEGGLTLDIAGFRREPTVVIRMLTLGVLITWAGTAAIVYAVYDVPLEFAVVAGSLVIVTGPTVVSPLLRRIGVQPRLHHVLYWEGVLVDAVGVFVAVWCYEWIAAAGDQSLIAPIGRFATRFAIGAGIGIAVGFAVGYVLKRRWVSNEHANIVVLGAALLALALANSVLAEAGILAVIVAGLVISVRDAPRIKQLKRFKLELTELGIGLLFVLLAANLQLHAFVEHGGKLLIILAVILFVLRPLNILVCTAGQGFSWRERAFLSWLAPRGIVAASMASLFALRLGHLGYESAPLLETLTYAVIGTTVLFQGLSAPYVARVLGLQRRSRASWLLVGDPALALILHRQLRQIGARSLVLPLGEQSDDLEPDDAGVQIISDPLNPGQIEDPRIADVEAVLALAGDPEMNDRICEAWAGVVGPTACYRWDSEQAATNHGRPVWRDLVGPGEASAAIANGTHAIEAVQIGDSEDARRFGKATWPMMAVDDGHIQIVYDATPRGSGSVVALRKRIPGLNGLIRDAVILDQDEVTFRMAVETLLARAAEGLPDLPVAEHLAEILDREQTMPTTMGRGVAIPHVYDARVERSTCFVASITGGLSDTGPDGDPVKLIFLVVSPPGKAAIHLRSLAAIAHLAADADFIHVLAAQQTRGRLLALLHERE